MARKDLRACIVNDLKDMLLAYLKEPFPKNVINKGSPQYQISIPKKIEHILVHMHA